MKIQENTNVFDSGERITNSRKKADMDKEEIHTEGINEFPDAIYEKTANIGAKYTTYNADGTIHQTNAPDSLVSNQSIQSALKALGFYAGPYDGSLTSNLMKKAIKHFQTVYGLESTGTMNQTTLSKLDLACYYKESASDILRNSSLASDFWMDYYEKENFAKIWAFLRVGMNLSKTHSSAVMANIKAESNFSSDNLQDTGNKHDKDYVYNTEDEIGYGIMQWTIAIRKKGLFEQAESMGLDCSDLNAQLAYFRTETNTIVKSEWNEFRNQTTLNAATDYFLKRIEMPRENNYEERRGFARQILDAMVTL